MTLDDVLVTERLARRLARLPDHGAESRLLLDLARHLGGPLEEVLDAVVENARTATRAGTGGFFLWGAGPLQPRGAADYELALSRAFAGDPSVRRLLHHVTQPTLLQAPARVYASMAQQQPTLHEVLLAPVGSQADGGGGAIWVGAQDATVGFDAEDARLLQSIATFTTGLLRSASTRSGAPPQSAALDGHFRALVAATTDVIYVMNPDWSEMRPLDGKTLVPSNIEPLRDWMEKNLPPCEHDRVRAAIARAIATRTHFELEHQVLRPDGAIGWTFSRAIPLLDDNGSIIEWLGAASDVTRRRQAEEALRQADRTKDQFIATVAHELRNPLAPISMGIDLLCDDAVSDKKRTLAVMRRQVTHMVRLVDDLLDISRIAEGKLELKREVVELGAVLDAAVDISRPFFERAKHRLHRTSEDRPTMLHADAVRLAQIVSNLLNNAAKYTPPGGDIQLSDRICGDHVEICVRDTGVGLSRDQLQDVFEIFRQVGRSHDRTQGLGIGLALVRSLVEMHGGSVWATSEGPGLGSTFRVRLPRHPER